MAKTLDLTIRIAGKMDKSLTNAISQVSGSVSSLSTTLGKVGTAGLAVMGTMATGTVAALAKCSNAAKDFEKDMSDVVKYVGGLADQAGKISNQTWSVEVGGNGQTFAQNYDAMADAILDLSTQIPMTPEELTKLAAAAGQSGKSMSDLIQVDHNGNITGFLRDVAMMGTAMDISAEQAGDWAAKWEVALGMPHEEVMELADQINYLGANNATTAAEIATVVNEVAGLGKTAGVSADTTAAFATAMLASGVNQENTASSMARVYTNLSMGSTATGRMQKQWAELGMDPAEVARNMQKDSTGTMLSVFNAIKALDKDKQVAALNNLFGQWAIRGTAKVTENLDVLTNALEMVNDPSLYEGSMEREFAIKIDNAEALEMMTANAWQAFQIDIGQTFLPARKELSLAFIETLNTLRNMPELGTVAQMLAGGFAKGVETAGRAMEVAMPHIQNGLEYLVNNGPQVISVLKGMAAIFLGMHFAPQLEGLLGGVGSLLLGGSKTGSVGGRTGGLLGLFKGGQQAGAAAAGFYGNVAAAAGSNGILSTIGVTAASFLAGNGLQGTGHLLQVAADNPGILSHFQSPASVVANQVVGSGFGQYVGSVAGATGNFLQKSNIAGATKKTGGVLGEVLMGISQATGLTDLVNFTGGVARTGVGKVGRVATMATASRPVQAVTGLAGRIATSAPARFLSGTVGAGAGMIGSMLAPFASGFGSLLAGALPVVGVISAIIAVVSILGDNLDGIRTIIGNTFGEQGLLVFDTFIGKIEKIGDFVTSLFAEGGVAEALAPLQEKITGMFGENAGAAFAGVVDVLQSVMTVVGQLVNFSTTTVKPILKDIFQFITTTAIPLILRAVIVAAPYIANIIKGVGSAVMVVTQMIGTGIQMVLPIVKTLITVILMVGQVVIPAALGYIQVFSDGILTIVGNIQTIFQGVIDFITGVFTGNWKQAWTGVKEIFGGIFSSLVELAKLPINGVIGIINGAIDGINGIGFTMPEWSPIAPGENIGFDIPKIPMLAKGGFTNGVSIAGEAGREAVISFQRGVRNQNIATWVKAGQMLGVSNHQATLAAVGAPDRKPVKLLDMDREDRKEDRWNGETGDIVTFSPTIVVHGNASQEDLDQVMREEQARFEAWYQKMQERKKRLCYT